MAKTNEKSLLVIGECMMELAESGAFYKRAFAGDTYNSAVYAKRRHPNIDVQILTAVGSDAVSEAMKAQWDRDGIGHQLVMTSENTHPGIYAIATDDQGERSFTYWRKNSAATEFVSLLTPAVKERASAFNLVFVSGISLAILSDPDKADFLEFLRSMRSKGAKIAFDPNYREVLWNDKNHAAHWVSEAYRLTDVALPGLTDQKELFGHQCEQDVRLFLDGFEIKEVVLKAEDQGVYGYQREQPSVHLPIAQQANPTDTTGAGDSFAGTYLAERLAGTSMELALKSAAKVASLVIQHSGAIVDETLYEAFTKEALK